MKKIKLTPIDDYKYIGDTYFIKEGLSFSFNDAPYIPACKNDCLYYKNSDYEAPCRNCYGLLILTKQQKLKDIENPDQNYHKYYTPIHKN